MFRQGSTVEVARSQLFHRGEPIHLGRAFRTASRLPELMRESCNLMMSEWHEAVRSQSLLRMLMGPGRVLEGLA